MPYSLCQVLCNSKHRHSLLWELRRVIEEHRYKEELAHLSKCIDKRWFHLFEFYAEALEKNEYLGPACTHARTTLEFVRGDD